MTADHTCPVCHGKATVPFTPSRSTSYRQGGGRITTTRCAPCHGTGRVDATTIHLHAVLTDTQRNAERARIDAEAARQAYWAHIDQSPGVTHSPVTPADPTVEPRCPSSALAPVGSPTRKVAR